MLFEEDYILKAGTKEYLADIIDDNRYDEMFRKGRISVLNKSHCGNGGTTGFINYALNHNRGCLVLVPNISICQSKEEQYDENDQISVIYGGCKSFNREARICIATYDQFINLMDELYHNGFSDNDLCKTWEGRTIIIDEYHKIVDDCGFRRICFALTSLIQKTADGVILMSATPHWGYIELIRQLAPKKTIKTYTVDYEDENEGKINLYSIDKKSNLKKIIKKIKEGSKGEHICVFWNCVNDIKKILNSIGNEEDMEVLCSEKNKDELGNFYSDKFTETKTLHFLTSAYFTGHDIYPRIKYCIIVGSGEANHMCIGERDIKQIIGRFRYSKDDKGVSKGGVYSVNIFYIKTPDADEDPFFKEKLDYNDLKNLSNGFSDNWIENTKAIEINQDLLRLEDTLDRSKYWSSYDNLYERLKKRYVVERKKIEELPELAGKPKHISFKVAKQRIAAGKKVEYLEYEYANQIRLYAADYGINEMLLASKSDIVSYAEIKKTVGGTPLSLLTPEEKFSALGLSDFGLYRASYLMSCLKYLGVLCEYDQLSIFIREELGCCCLRWKPDDNGNHRADIYYVFRPFRRGFREDTGKDLLPEEYRISYQTAIRNKRCMGRTILIMNAPAKFKSLEDITLYKEVMKNKATNLPKVKDKKEWKNIKNYEQTKISELYKDTDEEYPFKKDSMEAIDSLIVDIDSGLTFSQFKERYSKWSWIAYPTINNTEDDWKKFRVIIPLKKTLKISGEYTVLILKMLRHMFCYYEDPNHQVASYINKEDWNLRRTNKGEEWFYIPQTVVDYLMKGIKTSKEYIQKKIDRKMVMKSVSGFKASKRTLEWAKDEFKKSFEIGDGGRYKRLYVIKINLSDEDRVKFQSWIADTYPKYLDMWKCHRVKN